MDAPKNETLAPGSCSLGPFPSDPLGALPPSGLPLHDLYSPRPRCVSRRPAASFLHSERRLVVGPLQAPRRGATRHWHIFCRKLRPLHLHPGEQFPSRSPSFVDDLVVLTHNDPKEVAPARTSPLDAFPPEIPQSGWSAFLFHC